jgi:hypothetical protein
MPAPLSVPDDPMERDRLARDGYLIQLLESELRNRPLCITFLAPGTEISRWIQPRFTPVPIGIILRLHPRSRPVHLRNLLRENERLWAGIVLPDLNAVRTDQEMSPQYVAGHYAVMLSNLGGLYEMAGDTQRARDLNARARAWAPAGQTVKRASRGETARSPKGDGV